MALSLNNPNMTPPGLFRYRVPETGHIIKDYYSWNDIEEAVVKHYRANHLPVPGDLRQLIIDQLCQTLPNGWCRDSDRAGFIGFARGLMHEFQRIVQGTITLADWVVADGAERVDDAEVTRRGEICKRCVFNQPPIGCSSCSMATLNKIVEKFVGGQPLPIDNQLESCMICGCNLRVKARLSIDVLKRHIKPEQMLQFPPPHESFQGCWLRETENQNA